MKISNEVLSKGIRNNVLRMSGIEVDDSYIFIYHDLTNDFYGVLKLNKGLSAFNYINELSGRLPMYREYIIEWLSKN